MSKSVKPILLPDIPPPLAAYSPAMQAKGHAIHVSGILPVGRDGSTVGVGDVRAQAGYVLDTIRDILAVAGATMKDIAINQIFLRDMADYGAFNEVYKTYFPISPPARYCIRADLVKPEFLVEIVSTAYLDQ